MPKDDKIQLGLAFEAVSNLERVLLAGDSPGVKMAAAMALEVLLGRGAFGRPVSCRPHRNVLFCVSVTILSDDMERVLMSESGRGAMLPRKIIGSENTKRLRDIAHELAVSSCGDASTEMTLGGRALSVEIWDDSAQELHIGFNFLAISRNTPDKAADSIWQFIEFSKLNIGALDPREALALSEMLTIMGVKNPYDIQGEDDDSNISAA